MHCKYNFPRKNKEYHFSKVWVYKCFCRLHLISDTPFSSIPGVCVQFLKGQRY